MKLSIVLLVSLLMLISACTRRPVQKDIVFGNNSMNQSSTGQRKIASSPGVDKASYDLQFIDTMVELHLSAIDAEQLVATRAQHAELKVLAKTMIAEQQDQIASMRELKGALFGNDGQAVNVELPGVREGFQSMDLERLDGLKERAFDLEFVRQIISLKQAVISLANDGSERSRKSEIKQFTDEITSRETSEMEQLKKWESEWSRQ